MLIEIKLFQDAPIHATIPVIPITTTPCSRYIYNEYEPETTQFHPDDMTSEDVPWFLKPENADIAKEIYDATSSDRTQAYTCKACGIIPSVKDRRYIVHNGKMHLVCSAECVKDIKSRRK
jgi:hypothetical protein